MTIDELREEAARIARKLHGGRITVTEAAEWAFQMAREYAASQVEEHARTVPWPWPPRRPYRGVGGKQEAS